MYENLPRLLAASQYFTLHGDIGMLAISVSSLNSISCVLFHTVDSHPFLYTITLGFYSQVLKY